MFAVLRWTFCLVASLLAERIGLETRRAAGRKIKKLMSVRRAIRSVLCPMVRGVREMLAEPEPEVQFGPVQLTDGPAAGVTLILPRPSELTELIVNCAYEPTTSLVMAQLLAPDDHCWDIGSHYGYFTSLMAKLVPQGSVNAFDPLPAHVDRLRQGMATSGLDHVHVHQQGVAGKSGEMVLRFAQDGQDDSMAYLEDYGGVKTPLADQNYPDFGAQRVPVVTLDEIDAAVPALIKIDAEGAEAAILSGGVNLFRTARPRVLVETHGVGEALQCANQMQTLDYIALALSPTKETLPVLWVHSQDQQARECLETVTESPARILFQPERLTAGETSGDATAGREQG